MKEEIQIRYLYHSGFAVKTQNHFLIFDYYPVLSDKASQVDLEHGFINPKQLSTENVIVFSSHRHGDHFTPEILTWKKEIPQLEIILSDDILVEQSPGISKIGPNQQRDFTWGSVSTLKSTDEGVAFLVKIDGICLYHAGDLNWWHWNGETDAYNKKMKQDYQGQIDLIKNEKVDIAFVPMDPRLQDKYLYGIDYYMKTVGANLLFPMHFGQDYRVFDWLAEDARALPYRGRIQLIQQQGQLFTYTLPQKSGVIPAEEFQSNSRLDR